MFVKVPMTTRDNEVRWLQLDMRPGFVEDDPEMETERVLLITNIEKATDMEYEEAWRRCDKLRSQGWKTARVVNTIND